MSIDTAETRIERETMELIEEKRFSSPASPLSFIDSEFEEAGISPEASEAEPSVQFNSYGRPIAAILPTPKTSVEQPNETLRSVPTYPPNSLRELPDSHQAQTVNINAQRVTNLLTHEPEGIYPQTAFIPEELPYPITNDITPVVIHLPLEIWELPLLILMGNFSNLLNLGSHSIYYTSLMFS